MNRRTKDPKGALQRLSDRLGATLDKPGAQTYRVALPKGGMRQGNAKRCLAWLVEMAQYAESIGGYGMTAEQVRDVIRLDRIEDRGMKAHEYATVKMVTLAHAEGRR